MKKLLIILAFALVSCEPYKFEIRETVCVMKKYEGVVTFRSHAGRHGNDYQVDYATEDCGIKSGVFSDFQLSKGGCK